MKRVSGGLLGRRQWSSSGERKQRDGKSSGKQTVKTHD
jgi:hypothetical protein